MTALSGTKSTLLLDLVLLPLEQHQLLLPATALAEVLPKWQSSALSGAPDWCEGLFEWRNRKLLLINFDRWSGSQRTGSLSDLSDRSELGGRARRVFHDFEAHSGPMQREIGEKWTALPAGAVDQPQVRQAARPSNWLAVCNRSHGDLPFTHYGLILTGRPRLQRLRSNQLKSIPTPPGTGISTMALVEGERYAIPDLAALERQISQLVFSLGSQLG